MTLFGWLTPDAAPLGVPCLHLCEGCLAPVTCEGCIEACLNGTLDVEAVHTCRGRKPWRERRRWKKAREVGR